MQKRTGLLTVFSLFFIGSLILLFLFRQQLSPFTIHVVEQVTFPLQKTLYGTFGGLIYHSGKQVRLEEENQSLAKQIVDQTELAREASALRDQYDLDILAPGELLPANVIGMKTFLPGVSLPEEIIIDKGSLQGVRVGQSVLVTNNVVGTVSQVTENRSLIALISHPDQSVTAKTNKTNALGIIKGNGNGMLMLENVVLSDTLEEGDIVVTKGDEDLAGSGYPPDLVIGKIKSVEKKASDLFQTAEVTSLVDFSRLDMVFIIKSGE